MTPKSDKTTHITLIGADDLEEPEWAQVDGAVAEAGVMTTMRALPAAIMIVARLTWRTAPRLACADLAIHLLSGAVTAFGLLATANVFTQLLEEGPTPDRLVAALPAIALVAGSFVLNALLDSATSLVSGALRPKVSQYANERVNEAVVGVRLAAFDDADFRELVRQGGRSGVQSIEQSLRSIGEITASVVSLAAALVTIGLLNPLLLPALLLAAGADAWAAMRSAKLGYQNFLRMVTRNMRASIAQGLISDRDTAAEVRACGLQAPLLAEHRRVAGELTEHSIALNRRQTGVMLIGQGLAGLGGAVAYLVLGVLLYTEMMPLALAGAAAVAMRTAGSALSSTMFAANSLYEHSFYIAFYESLLAEARLRHAPRFALRAPEDPDEIRLRGVDFTYPGSEERALIGVDLTIRRGEVIALVGENGSGKTTLAKIIVGLYAPTAGTVHWDEVDIAHAAEDSVHERIAVIAQDPARWPMTAALNIRIGRLAEPDSDGSRWAGAVERSGADEVIDDLPAGTATILSKQFKGGHDLSGGQWQRLGVARGIYRDASILIADEPTAALDAKAEARVFEGLRHAVRRDPDEPPRTTVLITHRLANISGVDRIIVLRDGRIIESGTHQELMARDGHYAELFTIQASAFQDPDLELGTVGACEPCGSETT